MPKLLENLPPSPVKDPHSPRQSLIAYVWRGDKFDDIGRGETTEDGHRVHLAIGAAPPDVIELRPHDPAHYPGVLKDRDEGPKPTFLAFFADTDDRAGTAWPHQDGKGHRLKLRHRFEDGTDLDLRPTGFYGAPGDYAPSRRRTPRYRPRINA